MIESIAANSQLFFLIFVRILALLMIAPLLSSAALPQIGRIALAFFTSFLIFPWVQEAGYPLPDNGLAYALLVVGEVFLGIVLGFFLVIIYAAFQVAGQFFSLQMGLGASQVFDPLAQIQIPLMGQFLNIMAMFVFLTIGGFNKLFLTGVYNSFKAIRAVDLVVSREYLFRVVLRSLSELFEHAMVIAIPVIGTLFLVSVTMGLLAKASPQMNLLMLGFPIAIGVSFIVLLISLPFLVEIFARLIDTSFIGLTEIIGTMRGES